MSQMMMVTKTPAAKIDRSVSHIRKTNIFRSKSSAIARVQFLQRTIGNKAVQKLIGSRTLQAKLGIGQPGDKYEQEADKVAEQVMRMPEPRNFPELDEPLIQKMCPGCEEEELRRQPIEEEEELQKQPIEEDEEFMTKADNAPDISHNLEPSIQGLRGRGMPLQKSMRTFFEPRFGQDFSQVRVHADAKADMLNRMLSARAFTTGQEIFFRQGEYNPCSSGGKKLLAHELTHVVQQSGETDTASQSPVRQRSSAPLVQGTWSLEGKTDFTGGDKNESGNGWVIPMPLPTGVSGYVKTWQSKPSMQWCIDGGTASLSLWKTTQYTFKHDGRDTNFLELTVTGDLSGGAKAEDLHYAKSGATVVGLVKVRTPTAPTPPPTKLFDIEDGGKSSAKVGTIADIEATIPIDGTVTVKIPLKAAAEGELADFSEGLTPPRSQDVAGVVGSETIVDLYLGARVEVAADVESTCIPEEMDKNWAHAKGTYSLLRWRDRAAPAAVPPAAPGAALEGEPSGPRALGASGKPDVYRSGNSSSPRIDNVRVPKDIEPDKDGYVYPETGGVSSFSTVHTGKFWWKYPVAISAPEGIRVRNDHGDHYAWEPAYKMLLDSYKGKLKSSEPSWEKQF